MERLFYMLIFFRKQNNILFVKVWGCIFFVGYQVIVEKWEIGLKEIKRDINKYETRVSRMTDIQGDNEFNINH